MSHASKKQLNTAAKKGVQAHGAGRDVMTPVHELFESMKKLMGPYVKRLRIARDDWGRFDLEVKYPVEVGGKIKKNVAFCSVIEYRTYVGLYVMPVYTSPDIPVPGALLPLKTGKSCFKITKIIPALKTDIRALLATAFDIYKVAGWV